MNDYVLAAKLGKTYALDGSLHLHNLSDFYEQFKKGARFYLKNGTQLEISRFDSEKSLVKFVGINSVQAAKKLVNAELFSTKEETRKAFELADGEHFYFDVIGLEVVENEQILGIVSEIYEQGANYLLEIQTSKELIAHYERANNSADELQRYFEYFAAFDGKKIDKNAKKRAPKIQTLAKTFYLPYVDKYVLKISDKVYAKDAFEILRLS